MLIGIWAWSVSCDQMPMGTMGLWAQFGHLNVFKSTWAVWAFGQNSEYKLKCPWAFWAFGQNSAVANNGNQNAHGHFGHMGRISKQKSNAHGHYGRLGRVPLFWGKCPQWGPPGQILWSQRVSHEWPVGATREHMLGISKKFRGGPKKYIEALAVQNGPILTGTRTRGPI